MQRLRLVVASALLAVPLLSVPPSLPAQAVESLALPDLFDSRATADRLNARIAELSREEQLQRTLNNIPVANQIAAAIAQLKAWRNGTTPIPPAGIEIHAVSFYEGAQGQPRTAQVNLTRVATPVLLLLNAYESITWTLAPLPPGVVLLGVLAVSYDPQVINGVPAGVPVVQIDRTAGGTYYGRPDLLGRTDLGVWSLLRLGAFPTTFQGLYTAPSGPFEVGPGSSEWVEQWVLNSAVAQGQSLNQGTRANLAAAFAGQTLFPLLTPPMRSAGPSRLVIANPYGPTSGPLATLNNISAYALGPTALFGLNNRTPSLLAPGSLAPFAIPPDPTLPAFSWVTGIAFDWIRNRLLVSSFGGVGYLYDWDLATGRWSVVNTLNNVDLAAICWHPVHDAVFGLETGLSGGGPFRLRRYDSSGTLVATLPLGLWTWGTSTDSFQMYALGTNVAIVGPAYRVLGAPVRHLFIVDPTNGDIVFATYWI